MTTTEGPGGPMMTLINIAAVFVLRSRMVIDG